MKKRVALIYLLLLYQLSAFAQNIQGLQRCEARDQTFISKLLPKDSPDGRRISVRFFLPKGFHPNHRYSVVYFLHGRNSNREMLDLLNLCSTFDSAVERGITPFIIAAPDGGNHYWMNEAITGERWGDLITHELISWVESTYPVFELTQGRLLAGISMGGHGAFQLGLNHPRLFGAIAGHSPVFRTEEQANMEFHDQFGTGPQYLDRDPISLIQIKGKRLNAPLWVDIGGADPWMKSTENFGKLLLSTHHNTTLKIGLDPQAGHDLDYWKKNLPLYLEWYSHQVLPPLISSTPVEESSGPNP